MECPTCKGTCSVRALVNYGRKRGCIWEQVPCITCDGLGHISLEFAEKLAAGEKLYQERVAAGISVRDAATARGMTMREYVDLEHGRR